MEITTGSLAAPDGSSVTLGALADAAVVGDVAGTISAKLRGLSRILNDVWDDAGNRLRVDGSGVTQPVSGTVAATQSGAWTVGVNNLPVTQPVSGTVAATQGTSPWTCDTELPAAVALSDTFANPTAPAVGAFGMLWDAQDGIWRRASIADPSLDGNSPSAAGVTAVSLFLYDSDSPTLRNWNNSVRDGQYEYRMAAIMQHCFNGSVNAGGDRVRSANTADNTAGLGVPAAGNMIWDGSVWRRMSGSAAGIQTFDLLGKAEDAAHVSGAAGLPIWTVRNDALAAGSLADTDGDYQAFQSTPKGDLRVCGFYSVVVSGTLTRPANTTTYTINDELTDTGGAILTIFGCARYNGGAGIIDAITVIGSVNAATDPSLDIYVFDTTSTPAADNAAFAPTDAVMNTVVIAKSLGTAQNGDTATTGNLIWQLSGLNVPFVCGAASNSLFVRFAVRNGYVPPSNSEVFVIRLHVRQM